MAHLSDGASLTDSSSHSGITALATQKTPRVLVADEDPHAARLLGLVLQERGYATIAALDTAQAVNAAQELGLSGAFVSATIGGEGAAQELAERLRDEWHVPVVIIDGGGRMSARLRDSFHHVTKPLEVRAVWRAVRAFDVRGN
jgi:DNA-binding response OmpR family regulator